ncbi:MAG: nreB [Verrucomicrobiales bacterium]|nr:nreB [Verrucomicrobiales bacterium]
MDDYIKQFRVDYEAKLRRYLESRGEDGLEEAYQCGRQALSLQIGLLDLAKAHEDAQISLLSTIADLSEKAKLFHHAGEFFREALSPFEAVQRGFRETGAKYSELNQELARRNLELAETNHKLEVEAANRKNTERALRASEEHYRDLFQEAKAMQENLRSLSHRVLQAQEEERKRISRELHDEVGQSLTAINVNLTVLHQSGEFKNHKVVKRMFDTQQIVRDTMDTVHRFSKELRPPHLDDLGLIPALRSYTKTFSERTGLRVFFTAGAGVERLGPDEKIVLYRAAQEGLTNVARHAEATQVKVRLRNYREGIRLEIHDNGKSFSLNGQEPGKGTNRLGLLGMQERVRLVNGRMAIEAEPGKGTLLRVSVPFKAPKIPVPETFPGTAREEQRAYS